MSKIATHYHESCIKRLINLDQFSGGDGSALAAVCLLRSYELLAEENDPNRHLSGAYALAAVGVPDFRQASLLKAGFFVGRSQYRYRRFLYSKLTCVVQNYLREDITYSLIHQCSLKIDTSSINIPGTALNDEDELNIASLYLAQTINMTFSEEHSHQEDIEDRFLAWKTSLPVQFAPYFDPGSDNMSLTFPVIRLIATSHISVLQYCLVTEAVLVLAHDRGIDSIEDKAIKLCGLAFSSDSPAVYVNSFGPMSFCCRYLRQPAHQIDLVRRLHGVREDTGWPVERMVDDLRSYWSMTGH